MQLIIDCVGFAEMSLNESAGSATKFRGKFQEANAVNKNRRKYPRKVLDKSVEQLEETIARRGLFGELDHPQDSIVHLANASHLITKMWWDGDVLMGEGEVLNTPAGKVLKALIESGRVGMSSRGVGSGETDSDGVMVVGESFKLITFDVVADPSTFDAYQKKIGQKTESTNSVSPILQPQSASTKKFDPKLFESYFGEVLKNKLNNVKNKFKS